MSSPIIHICFASASTGNKRKQEFESFDEPERKKHKSRKAGSIGKYEAGFEKVIDRSIYLETYSDIKSMDLHFNSLPGQDAKVKKAMARCFFHKDKLETLQGDWYRWKLVYEQEISKKEAKSKINVPTLLQQIMERKKKKQTVHDNLLDPKNMDFDAEVLPLGWKLLLELKGSKRAQGEDSWHSHLSLQNSSIANAGKGIVAERRFDKDQYIGMYAGPLAKGRGGKPYRNKKPFRPKPTDEELANSGVAITQYCSTLMDKEGHYVVVKPDPGVGHHLYLGMHFINSWKKTVHGDNIKVQDKTNCVIEVDGGVKATKRIEPGTEILCDYGDHYDRVSEIDSEEDSEEE